jgi:NADH-quinone oxidoreductase subunit C
LTCTGCQFSRSPRSKKNFNGLWSLRDHPLRKDFPLTGHTEVRYSEDQKKVISEPVKLEQNYRNFDYESPWEGTKYIKEEIDNNDKKN